MAPDLSVAAAVALPFVAAGVTPLATRVAGARTGYAGAAVSLACFVLVATQVGTVGTVVLPWVPSLGAAVRLRVDGLSLLFALLASGVGVLVFAYSARYMRDEPRLARYYATLLAFLGSILGVAFAADLVVLFLFWELTSLCSFVLIGHHDSDPASASAARTAMVVTVGGGLCLLLAVLLLWAVAGGDAALGARTFDLDLLLANADAMSAALRDRGLFRPVLALFGVAAAAKSAQVPLHFWLPGAMVAPTPVSAFLHSATMVKVGVYVVGRTRPLLLSPEWTALFATLGLVTMTVGAVLAVAATDLKRLLAYSTASHLGLMIAAFGFRSRVGAAAGAFHLFNHALFKAALFLVAGVVAHAVGTRHLPDLNGLWRDLPVTAAVTAVAALSMAGIPPFNGFYSKELLFEATYEAAHAAGGLAWLYPATAVVASVCTVLYSLRVLGAFLGPRPSESVHRPPLALLLPPATLAAVAAVVSVAPELAVDAVVGAAVDATAVEAGTTHVGLPTYVSPPVLMSATTIAVGVAAYPLYERWRAAAASLGATASARRGYDRSLAAVETAGARLAPLVHNGLLRTYVTWVVAAASVLALLGYTAATARVQSFGTVAVPPAMALVLAVAVLAAVAVILASSHVAAVLTVSILGFMVAVFFVLASAPDLALTQLVVETLVLVIFLLILEELPAFYADTDLSVAARDAALSLLVGTTVFLTVLLTGPDAGDDPTAVARYYATEAVPAGGGTNVVNVILVDFRGFDTMGELTVVAVAAMSVLVLLVMRNRGEMP